MAYFEAMAAYAFLTVGYSSSLQLHLFSFQLRSHLLHFGCCCFHLVSFLCCYPLLAPQQSHIVADASTISDILLDCCYSSLSMSLHDVICLGSY